jgi:pSer/pThr/pTyr-binding forkhead associated (FHA) protein
MSPALALFLLRLALAVLLYAFLGGILYLLWLDLRRAMAVAQARDRARGRLILIACDLPSPQVGDTFPLLPITSMGRASTNTISLPDETASLEHALITQRSGKWWLEDLDSRNGTTLNGQAVTMPTVISAGDLIGLGRAQFKLELE